jgi:hypothetical protein
MKLFTFLNCLIVGHNWEYWRNDTGYRYCVNCGEWQKERFFHANSIVGVYEKCKKPETAD